MRDRERRADGCRPARLRSPHRVLPRSAGPPPGWRGASLETCLRQNFTIKKAFSVVYRCHITLANLFNRSLHRDSHRSLPFDGYVRQSPRALWLDERLRQEQRRRVTGSGRAGERRGEALRHPPVRVDQLPARLPPRPGPARQPFTRARPGGAVSRLMLHKQPTARPQLAQSRLLRRVEMPRNPAAAQ